MDTLGLWENATIPQLTWWIHLIVNYSTPLCVIILTFRARVPNTLDYYRLTKKRWGLRAFCFCMGANANCFCCTLTGEYLGINMFLISTSDKNYRLYYFGQFIIVQFLFIYISNIFELKEKIFDTLPWLKLKNMCHCINKNCLNCKKMFLYRYLIQSVP